MPQLTHDKWYEKCQKFRDKILTTEILIHNASVQLIVDSMLIEYLTGQLEAYEDSLAILMSL